MNQLLSVPGQVGLVLPAAPPAIAHITRVLADSVNAQADLRTVLKAQLLFWMMAAPGGHAKNFSPRILPRDRCALTPLYDLMSIWPAKGPRASQFSWHRAKLAMALHGKNRHDRFKHIERRHFNSTAARFFQRENAEDVIESVLQDSNPPSPPSSPACGARPIC